MPQAVKQDKTGQKLPQFRSNALISAGSNLAAEQHDVASTVTNALLAVENRCGVIRARSPLYSTPAFPPGSGPDFVNAAFSLETTLSPEALLDRLHEIEADFGRERRKRWGPRSLDLDLIAMDQQLCPDADTFGHWASLPLQEQMVAAPDHLILPHPRLQDRAFVLVPLVEVAPDWVHPVFGKTVRQMCDALSEDAKAEVQVL
jgi:2-amino-4-hydroxy-6-hydroxymethyldihydropteridine diphosphokinase